MDIIELPIDTSDYIDKQIIYNNVVLCNGYRIWTLNKQFNIKHFATTHSGDKIPILENDSIGIINQVFSINDLYYKSVIINNNWDYKNNPMISFVCKSFYFEFYKKKYLLIHIKDKQINGYNPFMFSLLFDITEGKSVIPIPIGETLFTDKPNYIGDFDKNNKLDIIVFNNNKLKKIELNDTSLFIKNTDILLNNFNNYTVNGKKNFFFHFKPNTIIDTCRWNETFIGYENLYINNQRDKECE